MLGFKSFSFTGNNCPYFTGIKDHGPKLTLDCDDATCDRFGLYCEGTASLHIHQDGAMYFTTMEYNNRNEDWEETIVADITKDAGLKKEVDEWLKANPLYRSRQFPYPISTERDFWGCTQISDSLDSLIDYLKAKN